jgi:ribosomal protein S18 acetylase RimI-like enzyme
MMQLRSAIPSDLDWLVDIDRRDEGFTWTNPRQWSESEVVQHRQLIRSFLDADCARIACEQGTALGAILWRICDLASTDPAHVFRQLDASVFPDDGVFVEIFQLWVDPAHRRRGIATALKRAVEAVARERNVGLIHTHTEETSTHVIALNARLGYREVRRGPIWDEIIRVSMVKNVQTK